MKRRPHHGSSDSLEGDAMQTRCSVSDFTDYVDIYQDGIPTYEWLNWPARPDGLPAIVAQNSVASACSMRPASSTAYSSEDSVSVGPAASSSMGPEALRARASAAAKAQPPPKLEVIPELGTPIAPTETNAERKPFQSEFWRDYSSTLPGLKNLVERQVRELSRSIGALSEFSDALPGVIDSLLLSGQGGQGPSQWRMSMLRRAEAGNGNSPSARPDSPVRTALTSDALDALAGTDEDNDAL